MIKIKTNKAQKLSDIDLIGKYKRSGNSAYIGVLFERYYQLTFGVCLKYLSNIEDSKDAVIQIFEKILSEIKTTEVNNFSSWLYSVSKNYCLMEIRSKKRRLKREETFHDEQPGINIEDEYSYLKEKIIQIKTALEFLNEEQRKCIELFYLEERTYQEIVGITGYSIKSVKSYIQNGKRNLKNILIW